MTFSFQNWHIKPFSWQNVRSQLKAKAKWITVTPSAYMIRSRAITKLTQIFRHDAKLGWIDIGKTQRPQIKTRANATHGGAKLQARSQAHGLLEASLQIFLLWIKKWSAMFAFQRLVSTQITRFEPLSRSGFEPITWWCFGQASESSTDLAEAKHTISWSQLDR
jgi:hypothetical protein